ncbi:DUF1540 domain-containing protein [Eubacteriales bacterium OttesenSCG-928-M02]|nr:DUF1540 domain-containing protein [Eubacteriales bacterium OttesenSCG-928-M02]
MANQNNQQTIGCTVESCRFQKETAHCGLEAITVAAPIGKGQNTPETESMCASYKRR